MSEELRMTIGHVAETIRGVTYAKADARSEPLNGYAPLLRATNIEDGKLIFDSLIYVPEHVVRSDQKLRVGDIVVAASSGSLSVIGKAAQLRRIWDGTFGAFCYAVRPRSDRVIPEYLAYFMQTSAYRLRVSQLAAGVNINNLRREHIENIELPYHALPVQQRIVDAIDSCFTRIDDAIATLENAEAKLSAHRSAILKAAVEGRLVATQPSLNREYGTADVSTKSLQQQNEETEVAPRGRWQTAKPDSSRESYAYTDRRETVNLPRLPEGWCWINLGELLEDLDQGWSPQCERRTASDHEWGVMKTSAVQHLAFVEDENKALPTGAIPREHLEVRVGDLLVTRAGPRTRVGVCCLVRRVRPHIMLCDKVYRLRVRPAFSAGYLEIVLNSPRILHEVERLKTGISDSGVNLTQERFKGLMIPLPPRSEQDAIELAVAEQLSIVDSVERSVTADVRRVRGLKQSILKWAFDGKLLGDEPDNSADIVETRVKPRSRGVLPNKLVQSELR